MAKRLTPPSPNSRSRMLFSRAPSLYFVSDSPAEGSEEKCPSARSMDTWTSSTRSFRGILAEPPVGWLERNHRAFNVGNFVHTDGSMFASFQACKTCVRDLAALGTTAPSTREGLGCRRGHKGPLFCIYWHRLRDKLAKTLAKTNLQHSTKGRTIPDEQFLTVTGDFLASFLRTVCEQRWTHGKVWVALHGYPFPVLFAEHLPLTFFLRGVFHDSEVARRNAGVQKPSSESEPAWHGHISAALILCGGIRHERVGRPLRPGPGTMATSRQVFFVSLYVSLGMDEFGSVVGFAALDDAPIQLGTDLEGWFSARLGFECFCGFYSCAMNHEKAFSELFRVSPRPRWSCSTCSFWSRPR